MAWGFFFYLFIVVAGNDGGFQGSDIIFVRLILTFLAWMGFVCVGVAVVFILSEVWNYGWHRHNWKIKKVEGGCNLI